jgi:hypothetical protein
MLHSVELKEKGKTPSPKRKTAGFTQTTPRKNIEPDNPPWCHSTELEGKYVSC